MNVKIVPFVIAASLAVGCFNPEGPAPADTGAAEEGHGAPEMDTDEEGDDEEDCLEALDAMCACAEAAGLSCSIAIRNLYEEGCADADLRDDLGDCIEEVSACEDAVAACMP